MDKEEEMLAISRLVFELTLASNQSTDMDVLLERLFSLLMSLEDLHLEPRGAILLLNPRGRYYQVAQRGMLPPWVSQMRWDFGPFTQAVHSANCQLHNAILHEYSDADRVRMLLLPLFIDGRGVGYTVLFVPHGHQLNETQCDFFNDLSKALSSMVERSLFYETLRIREFELEEARAEALRNLGAASEYRDHETGWHIMRMTNFAQAIAKEYGLPEKQRELLYEAAPMHDVGKIGIPDAVMLKPDKLTPEEFEIMKMHTDIGVNILKGKDELIVAARQIAGSHHEKWDGSGYPNGLKGEKIPLLARICSVADVFDALTSVRPYKSAWSVEESYRWILSQSGISFDPAVVQAFDRAIPEILRIRELYRDEIIDPKQSLSLPALKRRDSVWIDWEDSLSVGIDVIDTHHHYLLDLINDLYSVVIQKRGSREVAKLVKALEAYAKVHFRAEEQMMGVYGFPELAQQQQQHLGFESKVQEFYDELHDNPLVAQFDVLTYLRDWLIHHIRVEDAKLAVLAK